MVLLTRTSSLTSKLKVITLKQNSAATKLGGICKQHFQICVSVSAADIFLLQH